MNVFNRLKHNRTLGWTILFAQFSLLLLASVHVHHHETSGGFFEPTFVGNTGFNSESVLNDERHCLLCDVIQLTANGVPVEGFSIARVGEETPLLINSQPNISVCIAEYLSRGPPSILRSTI